MIGRRLRVVVLLALLGLVFGFFAAKRSISLSNSDPKAEGASRVLNVGDVSYDLANTPDEASEHPTMQYPENTVAGEFSLHFRSRQDYQAYLRRLNQAGLSALGQIDELLAVRIPEAALSLGLPSEFGAETNFTFRVKRPDLPERVAPKSLAGLSAYAAPAQAISGGTFAGEGAEVLVGILDSGIEAHAQFDDVYIVHIDLAGGGVDGDGAAHGTSVASIISGREGVAPQSELFVVRVLDDQGRGNSFDVAKGIVQSVDLGVKIINMSLGVYEDSTILRQAINYADTRGVLMVAAAGNDGYDRMPFPAAYPEVLSVTAVDRLGQQARFPNQSDSIDFAAPGIGILAAEGRDSTQFFSGTSAAAPFVTGTLASLISGPHALPPRQAVELMKSLLDDAGAPGPDPIYGGGIVGWDRIRERNSKNVFDVAVSGIYLAADAEPGTTRSVEVTVQNRGTRWLRATELEVFVAVEDAPVRFSIGALGPGQTATRKVLAALPGMEAEASLQLAARVRADGVAEDVRPENNVKQIAFRPAE